MIDRNPFTYDSRTQDYKDPTVVTDVSVSPDSAVILFSYFNEDGSQIPVEYTETPVSGIHPTFLLYIHLMMKLPMSYRASLSIYSM